MSTILERPEIDPSLPDSAANAAVRAAIKQLADVTVADFGNFQLKFANDSPWTPIWTTHVVFARPDTIITFFQFQTPESDTQFLPLGDTAVALASAAPPTPQLAWLIAPGSQDPSAVAHPTSFVQVCDDTGSGNPNSVQYYRMVAPPGYSGVGICFSNGVPNTQNYWCVKNEYLEIVQQYQSWSDNGQGWSAAGDLYSPKFNGDEEAGEEEMLIIPPVFQSAQDLANEPGYALVGMQSGLQINTIKPPAPSYDPDAVEGDTTTYGLKDVKIVPYTALPADGRTIVNQPIASPFYFIAAQPYWQCFQSTDSDRGLEETLAVTVGSTQTDSATFKESTSLSVSAKFGLKADPFSSEVSATFTHSFELSTTETDGVNTQGSVTTKISVPPQPTTWFWSRMTQIAVFRSDGSMLPPVSYGSSDLRFIPDVV